MKLLERFGVLDSIKHLPGELSAGERQRAVLARAVSPKMFHLDVEVMLIKVFLWKSEYLRIACKNYRPSSENSCVDPIRRLSKADAIPSRKTVL